MFNRIKWKREWVQRHKELGLCIGCNQKSIKGKSYCQPHLESRSQYDKDRSLIKKQRNDYLKTLPPEELIARVRNQQPKNI